MSMVAISQTLGSLGDEIGRSLAQVLGYDFVDREIVLQAAERFGKGVSAFEHVTEERPRLWERFSDVTRGYRTFVEAIIWEIAARDNVIIAGRGAPFVLGALCHGVRVRITGSERVRVTRVERRLGIDAERATDIVRQSDHERAARIRFLYHVDWNDPLLYDLVINTDSMDERLSVRLIQAVLESDRHQPGPDSIREVADAALAARARADLLSHPLTQPLDLSVACQHGRMSMRGIAAHEEQRRAAEEIVRTLPGVIEVLNEIVVTSLPRHHVGA